MKKTRVLTGITTSGIPHLGNYAGAIRPAIALSQQPDVDPFYFMADYHALIKCSDPDRVARARLQIAATWLAGGLDPEKATFYCQSDIPEIPLLNWMLTCVTPKGLMNRAHAYKASVDVNLEKGEEPDDGVTMGLFCYPILMAADILAFNAHKVPVGRDQVQHLEMARDIAQRFNHLYGKDYFVLPEVMLEENVAILPGLDGRKMSKSYDNTIPLFEGTANDLQAAINRIQTDTRAPGEPKDPDSTAIFPLYQAFATPEQTAQLRADLESGMAWGEAKKALFQLLDGVIAPMRARYHDLLSRPDDIQDILLQGAKKARQHTVPLLAELSDAVGLRPMGQALKTQTKKAKKKTKSARFVSFREADGQFRFRLMSASGEELLCSYAFHQPQAAGEVQKQLLSGTVKLMGDAVHVNNTDVATATASLEAIVEAIAQIKAEQEK